MKQIVQSYKTGKVSLRDVPAPSGSPKNIIVRNCCSLISIGTERSIIELGQKSIIGKALLRPDLVRRALDKAQKEGLLKTWQEAMGRLDAPTPLGYSSAGIVEKASLISSDFSVGDRVACIGQGFASHAEFISVPLNMACKVPANVSNEEASFGMLGVIALHGIRAANLSFGSRVGVVGLGLLGLLSIQILKAYGCEVIAYDPASEKVDIAKNVDIHHATENEHEFTRICDEFSNGHGLDAVIITAASKDKGPIDLAIKISRQKGRIVLVGTADIHPNRNELWLKELEFIVSKAGGPGSLDPLYEVDGVDFPLSEVRWPIKRNLQEFLRLIDQKKILIKPLISHTFLIDESESVYSDLISGAISNPIGVILKYSPSTIPQSTYAFKKVKALPSNQDKVGVAVIGAGLYGKTVFLPQLVKNTEAIPKLLVTATGLSAEHSGGKFKFERCSTDLSVAFESHDVQAVIGLAPHREHAFLVNQAIEKQKALLIEKPLCVTKDELTKLSQWLGSESHLPLILVGHNRRFSSHVHEVKKWLADRKSPAVIGIQVNAGFVPASHWVHSQSEGRSRIVGEMTHFVDLVKFLIGSQVLHVSAERTSGDGVTVINNDNISVNLKFSDGSIGNILYSASGLKSCERENIKIFFDGSIIELLDFKVSRFFQSSNIRPKTFKTKNQDLGYVEEINFFIRHARANNLSMAKEYFSDAIDTMRIIFAVEDSLLDNQPISVV